MNIIDSVTYIFICHERFSFIKTRVNVCVCVYICVCVYVCMCVYVYVYVYVCTCICVYLCICVSICVSVCVTGPDYWGRVNHEWTLCSKGLYQSPVDISPRTLVYDPNLRPVRLDQHRVS